jgi:hypothetical protein
VIGERWSPKLDGMLRVRRETQGAATNETRLRQAYGAAGTMGQMRLMLRAAAPFPTRELHLKQTKTAAKKRGFAGSSRNGGPAKGAGASGPRLKHVTLILSLQSNKRGKQSTVCKKSVWVVGLRGWSRVKVGRDIVRFPGIGRSNVQVRLKRVSPPLR